MVLGMPPDPNPVASFREAIRPIVRRLMRERTLSLGKSGMLTRLMEHGPATASELAAGEQISAQAVAVALRELEELGCISRTRDETDRRKVHVAITDVGRAAVVADRSAGTAWLQDAFEHRLTPAERATLTAAIPVLHSLASAAEDD